MAGEVPTAAAANSDQRAWEWEVRQRHQVEGFLIVPRPARQQAHRKNREILPQGLDGNVRLRGATPAHAAAPSGLSRKLAHLFGHAAPPQRALRAARRSDARPGLGKKGYLVTIITFTL